jgi:hypothetical protein
LESSDWAYWNWIFNCRNDCIRGIGIFNSQNDWSGQVGIVYLIVGMIGLGGSELNIW